MPSLTDLFNPTFLMFLGILVLVVALLVVYFESKMRDQNHKIASMLSLVSTLAEDMNGVKMGLNHFAMNRVGGSMMPPFQQPLEQNMPFFVKEENKLIEVSDDEDDDSENNESEFDDEEIDSDSDNDEESDSESDNGLENDIKILKINVTNDDNDIDETENLDLEETVSFGDFEPEDELPEDELSEDELQELSEDYTEEKLNLQYHETTEETKFISSSDLKTININLEESQTENCDFKKLSLPKLRSIVIEKRLASNLDANKFKKQELLKLLGAE
jgi:hypothetical protein